MLTKFAWIALFACALQITGALAAETPHVQLAKIGRTTLTLPFKSSEQVSVEIVNSSAVQAADQDRDAFLFSVGKLYGRQDDATNVISAIIVRWPHLPPFLLSLSAYADLHDAATALLVKRGERVVVQIQGGDGAVGYRAEITFSQYGAHERRVRQTYGFEEVTTYTPTKTAIENTDKFIQDAKQKSTAQR